VQVQYYPRIDGVSPTVGSLGGGTQVTIVGGGFPMDEANVAVMIAGRKCVVTYSNLESILCNTSAVANTTVASKVNVETYSVDASTVATEWLRLAETVRFTFCIYTISLTLSTFLSFRSTPL
jgi:hypothetical protein